jgi:hypothetical protein
MRGGGEISHRHEKRVLHIMLEMVVSSSVPCGVRLKGVRTQAVSNFAYCMHIQPQSPKQSQGDFLTHCLNPTRNTAYEDRTVRENRLVAEMTC